MNLDLLTRVTYSPVWIIILILYIIYHYGWKDKSWEGKRDVGTVVVIVLTLLLLPLHFWGMYSLAGVENGGIYEEWGNSIYLEPGETYTSWTLSNRYTIVPATLYLSMVGGNITFFLCDENSPEVHHSETTYSTEDVFFLGLPYRYTEFSIRARWTLNFYNPNQNTSIVCYFQIQHEDYWFGRDLFSDAIFRLQAPTIALFSVWILWGVITLAAYENEVKRLRPKIEQTQDMENQELEDYETHGNQDDASKYKRIRDRR